LLEYDVDGCLLLVVESLHSFVRSSSIESKPSSCWTPTRVCVVTTPIHSLCEVDGQSQPCRRGYHCWGLHNQTVCFFRRFGAASIFSTGSSIGPDRFSAACDRAGMKISRKLTEVLCLTGNPRQQKKHWPGCKLLRNLPVF